MRRGIYPEAAEIGEVMMQNEMNGAQMMVKCLEAEGVEVLFGYPGAAICPFYDALYDSKIRHVLVRAEQNSAHMASGYARVAHKAGVCVATSGPAATNLITGIATAYMDSIPIIAITGQVNLSQLGRDSFQEADITGACESFTKHSYLVKSVQDIQRVFKEAFHIATTGRPGPVLIDIPEEVQLQTGSFNYPGKAEIAGYKPKTDGHPNQIKKAVDAILAAKKPVICCGGGVVLADANEEMTEFAEKSGIPVVATMMGIGVMPSDNPTYLGMIGRFGRSYANEAIREADLLIFCGARVGDRAIALPDQFAERKTVIHIDIDPAEIGKNINVDVPIVGDIKNVLSEMTKQVKKIECSEWIEYISGLKRRYKFHGEDREDYVEPRSFIRKLSAMMDEGGILLADPGQGQIWAARNFSLKSGRFLTSGGLGTMGYALPAAIGAKLAMPQEQVVAICGDGAFQMSMPELAAVSAERVGIKIVVMDNRRLGMVRELQNKLYNSRHCGTHMSGNPDFEKLANAYGIKVSHAKNNSEASALLNEMLAGKTAHMLICDVDPETPSI